ncbi:hypothetical protein BXZ70DRAFT_621398 [Cristinia sonorae]|uniref:Uncharacterized protein n=1 Tax=Cristinia sonorae TaxID=1940300 RepID=A0A8K0UUQ6_9AGAR|nr:hypothetical protein BXZ70DRAFT_621398 [Cristinia sonorae]
MGRRGWGMLDGWKTVSAWATTSGQGIMTVRTSRFSLPGLLLVPRRQLYLVPHLHPQAKRVGVHVAGVRRHGLAAFLVCQWLVCIGHRMLAGGLRGRGRGWGGGRRGRRVRGGRGCFCWLPRHGRGRRDQRAKHGKDKLNGDMFVMICFLSFILLNGRESPESRECLFPQMRPYVIGK